MSVAYSAPANNVVSLDAHRQPPPAEPFTSAITLEAYRRLFDESRHMTQAARIVAAKHRRYYDGKIDPKIQQELRRKRQPDFNINRVRPGVEGMVGVVEKGKSDPRAYPRTPNDEDSAEVATDTLRYVADVNRWQQNKLKVFRNMCIEGTAAVIVEVDAQLEVKIRRWRYEEFFYDPYSREPDFSDASFMGGAKWQYVDDVVANYPEHEDELRASCDSGQVWDSSWDDRPNDYGGSHLWSDPKRKRMLVVEMYKREAGNWLKCCFVGDLKLEEGPSPYQDNDGKPCNPIEAHSVFVDDDNRRYGVVEDMIGPQDEINVYRRKGAHFATFRQLQESDPTAAGIDPDEARREAGRPDGVIPSGWNIVPNTDKFQMDMTLLAEAKSEIERIGPNPAILGREGADASGRQTLIRQQAGLVELSHLFAGLDDLEMRVYRQIWARIRQYWTQPKFIRVTKNPDAVQFIQINEPIWGPAIPQLDPPTGQTVVRPQFLGVKNEVAKMGVDIIVSSTPDTANVQQEQYNALVQLAQIPGALGSNPGRVLIQASSLPMKRELLEELDSQQAQAAQAAQQQAQGAQPPPMTPEQQAMLQLAIREKQAGIEKTVSQSHLANAQAVKAQAEAGRAHAEAATVPAESAASAQEMFTRGQMQQAHAVQALVHIRDGQEDLDGVPVAPTPDF